MPKPPLTPEQMKSFEDKFNVLVNTEPRAAKIWDGQFYWYLDKPKLAHIIKYFSPKSKDRYFGLIVRLDNRTI